MKLIGDLEGNQVELHTKYLLFPSTRSQDWTCPICKVKNSDILSNHGTRKVEELPEGLTIDPRGGSKKDKEEEVAQQGSSTRATIGAAKEENPLQVVEHLPKEPTSDHSFGASGPSDDLLASIVNGRARRDASLQNDSITSSCVTSGTTTPIPGEAMMSSAKISQAKGKQRQSSEGEPATSSTTTSTLATPPPAANTVQRVQHRQGLDPSPARRVRLVPHSTAEPERRLAVLDRAIATVLFLLLALVLRRVLNAVS